MVRDANPQRDSNCSCSPSAPHRLPSAILANAGTPLWDLDVGVIFTHEHDLIVRLLDTLCRSAGTLRVRLLLVDNASATGVAGFAPYFPQRLVLNNQERLGYAANLNRILQAATARYVLLLNTDMAFEPRQQCLARMVQFMDHQPHCGIAGCRIYHPDQTYAHPARRFPTPAIIAARRLPGGNWLRGTLDRYLYAERDREESFACDWLSGCFLLLRRSAAQQIGPFDESFGKYFEEVDYCLRAWRAGWRVMFHGATYCYHDEQRASRRWLSRDALRHLRSYGRWLRKWGLSSSATASRDPTWASSGAIPTDDPPSRQRAA